MVSDTQRTQVGEVTIYKQTTICFTSTLERGTASPPAAIIFTPAKTPTRSSRDHEGRLPRGLLTRWHCASLIIIVFLIVSPGGCCVNTKPSRRYCMQSQPPTLPHPPSATSTIPSSQAHTPSTVCATVSWFESSQTVWFRGSVNGRLWGLIPREVGGGGLSVWRRVPLLAALSGSRCRK